MKKIMTYTLISIYFSFFPIYPYIHFHLNCDVDKVCHHVDFSECEHFHHSEHQEHKHFKGDWQHTITKDDPGKIQSINLVHEYSFYYSVITGARLPEFTNHLKDSILYSPDVSRAPPALLV